MKSEMGKGIAVGLLVAYFLVAPVLNTIKLGALIPYVIIGGAVYLFFFKK